MKTEEVALSHMQVHHIAGETQDQTCGRTKRQVAYLENIRVAVQLLDQPRIENQPRLLRKGRE